MARQTPYAHSPEEGSDEAANVPWIIHVPVGLPETEAEAEVDDENPPEENPQ